MKTVTWKSILNLTVVVLIAAGTSACQRHDEGGVDGSGGAIQSSEYDTFKYVVGMQQAVLRDQIHRLGLVQKMEKPFLPEMERVQTAVLQGDVRKAMSRVDELEFVPQTGACPSTNHPQGDSSYLNNRICYSYASFKKFKYEDMEREMAVMTMHEFVHAVGGDETTAQLVQKAFGFTGVYEDLVLTGNQEFLRFREGFGKTTKFIAWAAVHFLDGEADWQTTSCSYLHKAEGMSEGIGVGMSSYVSREVFQSVSLPLLKLASDCNKLDRAQFYLRIHELVQVAAKVREQAFNFESPFCAGGYCEGSLSQGTAWLENYFIAQQPFLEKGMTPPETDLSKVSCRLVEGETVLASFEKDGGYLSYWPDSESNVSVMAHKTRGGQVEIEISPGFNWFLTSGQGFAQYAGLRINGYLQTGSTRSISAKLGLAKTDALYDGGQAWSFNPFWRPLVGVPQTVREVEVLCELAD